TSGRSPTRTSRRYAGLVGSPFLIRTFGFTLWQILFGCRLSVTQTVTLRPQDGLLDRPVHVGVVVHPGLDSGVPHQLLQNLGRHLARIAATESFAQLLHR